MKNNQVTHGVFESIKSSIRFKIDIPMLCILYSTLGNTHIGKENSLNTATTTTINTQSAETIDAGTWIFSLRNDFYSLGQYSDLQLLQFLEQTGRSIESDNYFNLMSFTTAYALTNTFALGVTLPFTSLTNIRTGDVLISEAISTEFISNSGNAQGFSDVSVYGQLQILNNIPYSLSSMIFFGSTLPTGNAYLKDRNGVLFSSLDQPGRGIPAPFIGLAVTKIMKNNSLSANIQFTKGLEGAQNTNLGNFYNYNVAWVHPLSIGNSNSNLSGILELNGEYYPKTITNQLKDPDSGASILYLTPGLRYSGVSGMSPYISIGIPILQKNQGIQSPVLYWLTLGVDIIK